YARYLAACLTYFSQKQRDRIGLITFAGDLIAHVPPSAKHLEEILYTLDRAKPAGEGTLLEPLRRLSEFFRRRSIVVLISDFYEEPNAVMDALKYLKGRGNDVIVFHVLDPAELEFPFKDAMEFEDAESSERMPVIPEQARAQYQALIQNHIETLGKRMAEQRIDYMQINTATPLDFALFHYLSKREQLSRVR
ncbi:MAG TPA: VWA domain-containing protein, partial [Longimicrobiales bacterium]|nr:VWA domain-containing protein [Longimicrobiales bacterium]